MACLGIRCGGAGDRLLRQPATDFLDERSFSISTFNRLHSLPFPNVTVKSPISRISTAATGTATAAAFGVADRSVLGSSIDLAPTDAILNGEEYDHTEKFDEWMRNSVTEIVKNIRQAPLLVQIYADGVVKTEKAEDWPTIIRERPSSPDGIILVEELREKIDLDDSGEGFDEEDGTKAFGVLIQGKFKGRDRCKSACTHFCLMKVHSFGKSVSSQFNECWLLQ